MEERSTSPPDRRRRDHRHVTDDLVGVLLGDQVVGRLVLQVVLPLPLLTVAAHATHAGGTSAARRTRSAATRRVRPGLRTHAAEHTGLAAGLLRVRAAARADATEATTAEPAGTGST